MTPNFMIQIKFESGWTAFPARNQEDAESLYSLALEYILRNEVASEVRMVRYGSDDCNIVKAYKRKRKGE